MLVREQQPVAVNRQASIKRLFCDENGRPQNWYGSMLAWVDAACSDRGICKHDFEHSNAVFQNGRVVAEAINDRLGHLQAVHPEILDREVINHLDLLLLAYAYLHDLGYPFSSTWNGLNALDHPKRGREIVEELIRNFLPSWAERQDEQIREGIVILQEMEPLLGPMIEGTTEKALDRIERLRSGVSLDPIPLKLAIVAAKVADNADLFVRRRVEHVAPPTNFEENPYYSLAWAVESYQLIYGGQCLQYSVQLSDMDFGRWLEETAKHYPYFWHLPARFAQLLSIPFQVIDQNSARVYPINSFLPNMV